MESIIETKNLISEAKNIYIIPEENNPEAVSSALALFYVLKNLEKNVNFIIEKFPEKLNFLIPSSDFISYPRNFVLSIPKQVADISQIYYENGDEATKIYLTIGKGTIKKDNISFYYSEAKPDLIITIGIKDYKKQLEKMDSFAFLLEAPILNMDTSTSLSAGNWQNNLNFGKINLIEQKSLSEIILNLSKSIITPEIGSQVALVNAEIATCLLSGLIIFSDNFTNSKTNSELLETASLLMKQGASREKIIAEIYKTEEAKQELFQKMFS